GFEMFGQMMHGIWQDFIRYVMHVQVQVGPRPGAGDGPGGTADEVAPPAAGIDGGDAPAVRDMTYSAPADPAGSGSRAGIAAAAGGAVSGGAAAQQPPGGGQPGTQRANTPVVKSEWDKTPRNAPCPCGSGRKFKQCHGR